MEKGEEKEFKIPSEEAYGIVNPNAKRELPKNLLPPGQEPEKGMTIMLRTQEGQQIPAKIEEVKESTLVLDMNHPLAGENLNFKIRIADIQSA